MTLREWLIESLLRLVTLASLVVAAFCAKCYWQAPRKRRKRK